MAPLTVIVRSAQSYPACQSLNVLGLHSLQVGIFLAVLAGQFVSDKGRLSFGFSFLRFCFFGLILLDLLCGFFQGRLCYFLAHVEGNLLQIIDGFKGAILGGENLLDAFKHSSFRFFSHPPMMTNLESEGKSARLTTLYVLHPPAPQLLHEQRPHDKIHFAPTWLSGRAAVS